MEETVGIHKALADETRLRILLALRERDFCVCDLVVVLDLSQPKISKHLSRLKQSGLVKTNRDERFVTYSLTADAFGQKIVGLLAERLSDDPTIRKDRSRMAEKDILRETYRKRTTA